MSLVTLVMTCPAELQMLSIILYHHAKANSSNCLLTFAWWYKIIGKISNSKQQ